MPVQKWSPNIWIAKLSDAPAFTEDLDHLLERVPASDPAPDLILDMANVVRLNSTNLSHLLRLRKSVAENGLQMRIAGPTNAVWALFLSTGLDKVFKFSQDTSTALADLQIGRDQDASQ